MDLLSKSDEEIFAIGKPFWENLVRSSNMKDYGGFTRDFSTQMLFGANEVELGKQWSNNELITNDDLNTYYGHHLPQKAKKTSDDILSGPSIDGSEDSPTKLSIFSNNKTSLNCCGDSPFSTTTGCVCLSDKQKKYIQNRGFNKQYEEL